MTPNDVLERAREIVASDRTQGSERVLAKEVIRLREILGEHKMIFRHLQKQL